ncbi:MAG: DUF3226 domain-containing protein [Bryobacter sp.]|nr:DUF3226 domain-containing protein [Bryobacter sp.]
MSKVRLLVEGKYDDSTVKAILDRLEIPHNSFEIKPCDGVPNLLKTLGVAAKNFAGPLAVLCDADDDPVKRWNEICKAASNNRLDLPPALPPEGLIHNQPGNLKFACWIMPDNQSPGALESHLLDSITTQIDLKRKEAAENFVLSTRPDFNFAIRQKSTLRVWFAVQDDPIWVPSFAIKHAQILPALSPEDPFIKWLSSLPSLL